MNLIILNPKPIHYSRILGAIKVEGSRGGSRGGVFFQGRHYQYNKTTDFRKAEIWNHQKGVYERAGFLLRGFEHLCANRTKENKCTVKIVEHVDENGNSLGRFWISIANKARLHKCGLIHPPPQQQQQHHHFDNEVEDDDLDVQMTDDRNEETISNNAMERKQTDEDLFGLSMSQEREKNERNQHQNDSSMINDLVVSPMDLDFDYDEDEEDNFEEENDDFEEEEDDFLFTDNLQIDPNEYNRALQNDQYYPDGFVDQQQQQYQPMIQTQHHNRIQQNPSSFDDSILEHHQHHQIQNPSSINSDFGVEGCLEDDLDNVLDDLGEDDINDILGSLDDNIF